MSDNTKSPAARTDAPPPGMHGGPRHGVVEKPKDLKGSVRRLWAFMAPEYGKIGISLALAIIAVATSVSGPYIMARATNHLADGVAARTAGLPESIDLGYIGMILAVLAGIYLVGWLFNFLQQRITVTAAAAVVHRMRELVVAKLDRLPLSYFDQRTYGEVLARITIDIDTVNNNLQQMVSQVLTSLVTLVGIAVMMFVISPLLALVALLTIPLTGVVTALIAPRSQKHYRAQQAGLGTINGLVEENYGAHAVIRAFGREQASIDTFNERNTKLYGSAWKAQFISSVMMPAVNLISNVGYIGIVAIAAFQAASGRIGVGDILAFIQYLQQFHQPLMMVAQISSIIQGTIAAAERVFALLDEAEEPAVNEAGLGEACSPTEVIVSPNDQATGTHGHVSMRCVNFAYDPAIPMIRDLSLDAKPGQTIAIVGPTGAGKTTVVNLLMRFYDIDSGTITVDGQNISSLPRTQVRDDFGMVLQDTWLFSGTIRDNIAYGREGASNEEVIDAAKVALADHFIRTLPHGYDTILNEDASNISVGQRQLLTIARAVLANKPILILDEATSSVDTRTERLIQSAMQRLMDGRTSFVIAHRLSTIRDADLILVMDRGAVVEAGTHDQLIAACGFYADLYNAQFQEGAVICDVA